MKALLVGLLLGLSLSAHAATSYFKLNTPMSAQVVACLHKEAPIAIHRRLAAGDLKGAQALVEKAFAANVCGIAVFEVIRFTRRVDKVERDGTTWSVYEAEVPVGGVSWITVYVPTENMEDEGARA